MDELRSALSYSAGFSLFADSFLFSANIEFLSILVEATLNKINTTLKNQIEYISSKEIQENHKLNFNVHIIYLNLFFPQKTAYFLF